MRCVAPLDYFWCAELKRSKNIKMQSWTSVAIGPTTTKCDKIQPRTMLHPFRPWKLFCMSLTNFFFSLILGSICQRCSTHAKGNWFFRQIWKFRQRSLCHWDRIRRQVEVRIFNPLDRVGWASARFCWARREKWKVFKRRLTHKKMPRVSSRFFLISSRSPSHGPVIKAQPMKKLKIYEIATVSINVWKWLAVSVFVGFDKFRNANPIDASISLWARKHARLGRPPKKHFHDRDHALRMRKRASKL